MITSITYQTLYSGMSRLQGKEKEEDSEQTENVDFSGFDLVKTVKDKGIGTICLDECHHLKNEWWKALEAFMENMSGVTVISLTATPPYDSNISQWERYISMCGDIDTEISIPELVKENSLCPHQDYVYFNYPTKEEEGKVKQFKENSALAYGQLLQNEEFANIIFTHRAITDCKNNADTMLENPAYIGGAARIILQTLDNALPYGQLDTYLSYMMIYSHSPNPQAVAAGYQDVLYSYPLYSLSLIIILSGIGLVVFRKRDFK